MHGCTGSHLSLLCVEAWRGFRSIGHENARTCSSAAKALDFEMAAQAYPVPLERSKLLLGPALMSFRCHLSDRIAVRLEIAAQACPSAVVPERSRWLLGPCSGVMHLMLRRPVCKTLCLRGFVGVGVMRLRRNSGQNDIGTSRVISVSSSLAARSKRPAAIR